MKIMQKLTEVHVYNCCEGCKFIHLKKSKVDWVKERYYCGINLSPYNKGFGYGCFNYEDETNRDRLPRTRRANM